MEDKCSAFNANIRWNPDAKSNILVHSIMFYFILMCSSFPVTNILTHSAIIHHMLQMFAKICMRKLKSFAITSIATTFAATVVAVRIFRRVCFSFLHCPYPTLNFCADQVSDKLVTFMVILLVPQTDVAPHNRKRLDFACCKTRSKCQIKCSL